MGFLLFYFSPDATCVWAADNAGSSAIWNSETVGVFGSGGMADYLEATDYAIGSLVAGHRHTLGLEEIALKNNDRCEISFVEAASVKQDGKK